MAALPNDASVLPQALTGVKAAALTRAMPLGRIARGGVDYASELRHVRPFFGASAPAEVTFTPAGVEYTFTGVPIHTCWACNRRWVPAAAAPRIKRLMRAYISRRPVYLAYARSLAPGRVYIFEFPHVSYMGVSPVG